MRLSYTICFSTNFFGEWKDVIISSNISEHMKNVSSAKWQDCIRKYRRLPIIRGVGWLRRHG